MKKSKISDLEQQIAQMKKELEELKNKPILTKEQRRKLISSARIKHKELTKFTATVRDKFEKKNDTYEKLAKDLDVTPGFARLIVSTDNISISERVAAALAKRYKTPALRTLVFERNEIGDLLFKKRKGA